MNDLREERRGAYRHSVAPIVPTHPRESRRVSIRKNAGPVGIRYNSGQSAAIQQSPRDQTLDSEQCMTDPGSEKPPRRIRYSGKNPRAFHEKYKELQADAYAEDVAKVLAAGKTPAGMHRPIMVKEVLEVLRPQPGDIAVDCTLGYGGHARELLTAIQPGGRLMAVDADPIELPKSEARLRALGFPEESLLVRRMNFAGLPQLVFTQAPDGVDLILADLGLSSMQIDNPARGFTFKADGPLDMRMNVSHGQPASELLSQLNQDRLTKILSDNADEPRAVELAAAILKSHAKQPLATTQALAEVVRQTYSRLPQLAQGTEDDAVRRVFQALRIAVNDEFGVLDSLLRNLPYLLKPGGRVAILTFHSGEDRRVKDAFKAGVLNGTYSTYNKEVIRTSWEEQRANPRSSSAKLRYAVKQ